MSSSSRNVKVKSMNDKDAGVMPCKIIMNPRDDPEKEKPISEALKSFPEPSKSKTFFIKM